MVRKTKADALQTRCQILDAAEQLFQQQGVSRTSLQDIAQAAGVTRGAVYWHFKDKSDLFHAMMQRVCLPMEESAASMARCAGGGPLHTLRAHLLAVLGRVVSDPQVQRVFQIATQKVEYAGELLKVRERHLAMRDEHIAVLERLLDTAQSDGLLPASRTPRQMAVGLHALIDGLIQNWMLDPSAFDLLQLGTATLDAQLAGLTGRAAPDA